MFDDGHLRRLQPGVLREELRDFARRLADEDVLGHDRAGEAAVANRVEDLREFSLRS